jgi:hypothetical protein
MEEQVMQLLEATQQSAETPRKQAELQLLSLYEVPDFPLALASIGSHESVPVNTRQAALLYFRKFAQVGWSAEFDEFAGKVLVSDENKARLRQILLDLALNCPERKVKKAASYVVSKVGSADFPEEWPDLLPTALQLIQTGNEDQISGALKLLVDLIEDSFNEEQFFGVANDLVGSIYTVAINDQRRPVTRALAISVFKGCLNILEMLLEEYKAQVRAFADQTLAHWIPFLIQILKSPLPNPPTEQEEDQRSPNAELFRGLVAFKLQAVKALMRIRSVFPANIAPQSPLLFTSTWDELKLLIPAYGHLFIDEQRQGRLEDDDNLPYTLDWLALEELDFMQACLRAAPVRKELESENEKANGAVPNWLVDIISLLVSYSQITTEEEALWNIDVNIFLSEESSTTTNYTPRTACGDMVFKLTEWLKVLPIDALLVHCRSSYGSSASWKSNEATLYILTQILIELSDQEIKLEPEKSAAFAEFVQYAIQQQDEFLRARGYLVAGSLTRCSGTIINPSFLEATLQALSTDDSDVVKVACVRALQSYLEQPCIPGVEQAQRTVLTALSTYLSSQDLTERLDSDDFLSNLVQTVREVIVIDPKICITGEGLTPLFTIAQFGAGMFTVAAIVTETFEYIVTEIASEGHEPYSQLCSKVVPSLTGAFHISSLTDQNPLTNLAAELLATLTKYGLEPLPAGFVAAVMPQLNHILMNSNDEDLLKSATCAVKNLLSHDHAQVFSWNDTTGKGGLEIILIIIDRLLGPNIDDSAGAEVGGLAAELVEKAGSERLGPYLMQLLSAVAIRLASAQQAQFIQSLILVFARLALVNAKDIVDFLAQVQVGNDNGLHVVMTKWLENSVNFAGYDEIRQK